MKRNLKSIYSSAQAAVHCHLLMVTYFLFLLYAAVKPADMAVETIFNCHSLDEYQPVAYLVKCTNDSETTRASYADPDTIKYTRTCFCIFQNNFTQTFIVSSGPKVVRLHFYLQSVQDLNISNAKFTISTGKYTLLRTENYSYPTHPLRDYNVMREYIVKVDDQILNITFTPSPNSSLAYAFVNKIEVIPIPPNLYIQDIRLPFVGRPLHLYTGDQALLETMFRVNIGGPSISPEQDTSMSRRWVHDSDYIYLDVDTKTTLRSKVQINYSSQVPSYTAPEDVYSTARVLSSKQVFSSGGDISQETISWSFDVELGFNYLIRLHFCEIRKNAWQVNGRDFQIYINDEIVEEHANVIRWSGGTGRPIYKDYVIRSSTIDSFGKVVMISLGVNTDLAARYASAILNGVEIFKLPDSTSNLAGIYPFGTEIYDKVPTPKVYIVVMGFLYGVLIILFLDCLLLYIPPSQFQLCLLYLKIKLRRHKQPTDGCQQFSLAALKFATNNFSDSCLIGIGGFGKVYKGFFEGDDTPVAIKRSNPNSHQGLHEFQTEISMLSKQSHRHLVSLIGYCMEGKEMILVYNFMDRGTLRDHLYMSQNPPLHWMQRLKICIGAARGLHYLHTGAKQTIIHRDVKSTNILLDSGWDAKVSDFGLSKVGPDMINQSCTHVSTMVKGSIGYLDPEYYRRLKLTEKSDVYSFGVVLFEVVCAKPAILPIGQHEDEVVSLATLALKRYQEGTLDQVIDPFLIGKIDPECFRTFTNIAKWCLADKGCDRPSMGDVLSNLEVAFQQQQHADKNLGRFSTKMIMGGNTDGLINDGIGTDNSDQYLGLEFSEILHPSGR